MDTLTNMVQSLVESDKEAAKQYLHQHIVAKMRAVMEGSVDTPIGFGLGGDRKSAIRYTPGETRPNRLRYPSNVGATAFSINDRYDGKSETGTTITDDFGGEQLEIVNLNVRTQEEFDKVLSRFLAPEQIARLKQAGDGMVVEYDPESKPREITLIDYIDYIRHHLSA